MKSLGRGVMIGIGGVIGICLCISVAGFVFMGAAANSSTTATAQPTAAIGNPGERIESGGIALTVLQSERMQSLGTFQNAEENNEYVKVEVLIENLDRDSAPYNPLYFSVKDAEGIEYDPDVYIEDDSLKSGDLFKGDKVRGFVAFKIKKGAADLVMSYEPLVILGGYETIRFNLP